MPQSALLPVFLSLLQLLLTCFTSSTCLHIPPTLLYRFVGRIVGKALHDGQLIDAYFTRSFYKHMLGLPLTHEDIEAVDPEYYKNLRWVGVL